MEQRQGMNPFRSKEPELRKPVVQAGMSACDLVLQNGIAYCEFKDEDKGPYRVRAEDVLEMLHKVFEIQ